MRNPMTLWYKQKAACLNEALPVGNGKLAAMIYGGAVEELIQLDDATFWSGEPSQENNRSDTPLILQETRRLLLEHNYKDADRVGKTFVGNKHNYGTHMPLGKLLITHVGLGDITNLERSLDLFTGLASTSFTAGVDEWHRECFASYPAKIFALNYTSNHRSRFTVMLQWEGIENNVGVTGMDGQDLLLRGDARETLHSDGCTGVSLYGRIRLLTDGQISFSKETVEICDASDLTLLVALETTMTDPDPDTVCLHLLNNAAVQGYHQLRTNHVLDVRENMNRVNFSLGKNTSEFPTDLRIAAYKKGVNDPSLIAQVFQYGRYLMLASSRETSPLPSHMGGIWNDNIYNKQDSTQDMHIDMNLQMQYWPVFPCGLAESFPPVIRWLRDVIFPSGKESARIAYAAEGWVAHVTSNPWGYTALGWAYNWGSFTFGGAWCATLLWDYFDYTRDETFLRTQAYPILLESAKFMIDYLFFDKDSGYWMSGPSYSPENHYSVDGEDYTLSLSTTCDILMIREVFNIVLKSARLLGLPNDETLEKIEERRKGLPPYQVGKHGQIQEWFYDFEEPIPNHRHTSHLLGLYPFAQITPEQTPKLAKAARTAICRRLKHFEATSWGYNMFASMFARLYDGNAAKKMIDENICQIAVPNMTIVMPSDVPMWAGTWELDGNTGLSSAICEMLAQSKEMTDSKGETYYEVRLLPALPDDWPDGEICGMCLRGGLVLNMNWHNCSLERAVLTPCKEIRIDLVGSKDRTIFKAAENEQVVIDQ